MFALFIVVNLILRLCLRYHAEAPKVLRKRIGAIIAKIIRISKLKHRGVQGFNALQGEILCRNTGCVGLEFCQNVQHRPICPAP